MNQHWDRSGAGFVTWDRYQDRYGAGFVTWNRYQGRCRGQGRDRGRARDIAEAGSAAVVAIWGVDRSENTPEARRKTRPQHYYSWSGICDVDQVPRSFRDMICDVEKVPGSFRGRICDVEHVPGAW